jgi:predicted anti-sigma-YlaC factor YlaD
MNCREFLERHSDYLDDHLAQDEAARWQEHVHQCVSCARYDRVVRRGTDVLRTQPEIEARRDLDVRVLHRALDAADPTAPDRWVGGAFALAIAAVLAIIAWSPVLRTAFLVPSTGDGAVAQTNAAVRPLAEDFQDVEQSSPMAMEMSSWTPGYAAPSLVAATIPTRIRTAEIVSPGPYSPLIVEPPRYEPYPPPRRVVWGASTRPRE